MAKNPCGKTRKVDNPYEIWRSNNGEWEWHVLKKYQQPDKELANPHARWFCAVYSPITRQQNVSGYDLGDVYAKDVREQATVVEESINYYEAKTPFNKE